MSAIASESLEIVAVPEDEFEQEIATVPRASLTSLAPEASTWQRVSPRGDESCRWERPDGAWMSLALGHGAQEVLFRDHRGCSQSFDNYETALALAASRRGL